MAIADIFKLGSIIPVATIDDARSAVPLARALLAGGLRVLEIALHTPAALESVVAIAREVPDSVIGVGTLTRPEDFAAARQAGAQFGVSPGWAPHLADAALDCGLPLLPGVMSPSEVMEAEGAGYRHLMLYPAEQAGGVTMLRELAVQFPDIMFCPSGGVRAQTAPSFLALPNVACVSGTWLTPKAAIAAKDWESITALASAAAALRRRG